MTARRRPDVAATPVALAATDALAGTVGRRRVLQVGSITILASAALAACSKSGSSKPAPTSSTSSSLRSPSPDVPVLRLASSLEHYVVGLYQTGAGSGLVKTKAIADAAAYFASQHADHAKFFEAATTAADGQPFTTANQVVAESLRPRVDALKTEADVVKLVYDVEAAVAATYFSSVGGFKDPKLNAGTMSVGGVTARHVAVLGLILSGLPEPVPGIDVRKDSPPYPAAGFQTKDGAIAPGTGV